MDDPLDLLRLLGQTGDTGSRLIHLAKVLDDNPTVGYILDDQFRFVHCNPEWDRFAAANGGRGLESEKMIGADLFASVPAVLADAYKQAFESVHVSGRVWVKAYECSSPGVFRTFQMRIHPLLVPAPWFLVTNPLVAERPHTHAAPASGEYFKHGMVTMCAHCRCSRWNGTPERWDFVPEYLQFTGPETAQVTHGLCPICVAYFYPGVVL